MIQHIREKSREYFTKGIFKEKMYMSKPIDLNSILNEFILESEISVYGNGHINDTYITNTKNYILQRINTGIFKNPDELMQNIENVTNHIRLKMKALGRDEDRSTLTVVKTRKGESYVKCDDDHVYRVYKFINGSETIEKAENDVHMYNAGKGFGEFQQMLTDYPVDTLFDTIPNFHNTVKRVEALETAIKENRTGRLIFVKDEVEFALSRAKDASVIVEGIEDGSIPLRVTHNDTKINNILFDDKTHEPLCVIDLDTVMQGSLLYDFGDAMRIGASSAAEDEEDLSKVWFDEKLFEAFAKGFLEFMGEDITPREKELLGFSAKLLTYECGIRFLTDYLNGDTYFKIHKPAHNLIRARNQFKLVKDIEDKMDKLNKIIENL